MSFTTPCFIRKNTPELRNKLKELGYIQVKQDIYYYHIMVENGNIWICNGAFNPDNPDGKGWDECIDCEYDEDLFIALAALRDDTDHNQWFTNGKEWIIYMDNTDKGGLSYFQYFAMPRDINLENFHKATPTEIIAHFKQKE
jgi:hypothetical protein